MNFILFKLESFYLSKDCKTLIYAHLLRHLLPWQYSLTLGKALIVLSLAQKTGKLFFNVYMCVCDVCIRRCPWGSVCVHAYGGRGQFQEQPTLFWEDSRVSTKVCFNVFQVYYKIIFERLNLDPHDLLLPTGSLGHLPWENASLEISVRHNRNRGIYMETDFLADIIFFSPKLQRS